MNHAVLLDAVFLVVLLLLAVPLGSWMAKVLDGERHFASRLMDPVEGALFRALSVSPKEEQSPLRYGTAFLAFNALGCLFVYVVQRVQVHLPYASLTPQIANVPPATAWNTALSFVTNTNWQSYAGESTLTATTQALALGSQNFLSAASGVAVLLCLVRGFVSAESRKLGNFWVDLVRVTLSILLPASFLFALFLVGQGVVQSLAPSVSTSFPGAIPQEIPLGPVASQIAIKQLGTNGGGYFNANSSHPFENPTPLSNFAETVAILLFPAALTVAFGFLVNKREEGRTNASGLRRFAPQEWKEGAVYLAAMLAIFVPFLALTTWAEYQPTSAMLAAHVSGPNWEGKELRFGPAESALWATATTAASNGSVNAMHDSLGELGSLGPMILMQLGEIVFGGIGSGLYGMIVFAIVSVFVSGLMVGRTPEYLGKKIDAFDMAMCSVVILAPATMVLLGTALAVSTESGRSAVLQAGPHGFSEILYALSSAANNNGSAFAGLTVSSPFWNTLTGVSMFVGRYFVAVPVIALAGSLAAKRRVPVSSGTLRTASPLFTTVLVATILLVGALTFIPALALGPVAEATAPMPEGSAP